MNFIRGRRQFKFVAFLAPILLAGEGNAPADDATVSINPNDKSVLITNGSGVTLVQPWSGGTVRVEQAPGKTIPDKKSFAVIAAPSATGWTATEAPDRVELKSDRLRADVNKQTGLVSFFAADGSPLLEETATAFNPAQNPTRDGLDVSATFKRAGGEHFYGGGVIGEDLRKPAAEIALQNNNTQVRIPVVYSSSGYGFFWDNASRGKLKLTQDSVTWDSSAGDLSDFYVFAGPTADAAVSEYRALTGTAPLFPKWAYGFWFCKNRFDSQQEILDAATGFRTNQFPVDLLVQDFFYWKPNGATKDWAGWGSHHFVPERYPDPKAMIDQLHNVDHIHFMTVIWPRFDVETDHAKELDAAHVLFPRAGTTGWDAGTRFYDPFSPKGREIYGRQVMESLLPLGVDAFWMDAAEPEISNDTFSRFDSITGPVSRMMDAFPLMHTTAVYTAQRAASEEKRVVLLPRSAWAGSQRNAAANWTGDIRQEWNVLAWQIEGLQNYSIAGLPYITTDVGGYNPGDVSESDAELFVRWFQWGTFCPIYRVHGVGRPFPWQYGPGAEAILKKFDLLRYRLLPYIYTQAGQITRRNGTIMRPLVMDFQDDPKALDTWDEFLFGPSLLVCPVYQSHKQIVSTVDQWNDVSGAARGVTATFLNNGGETSVREDLEQAPGGVRFEKDPTQDPSLKETKSVRVEGAYTPGEDGKLELEIAGGAPDAMTIDGQAVTPDLPAAAWQFPQYPLSARAGVPIKFSFNSHDKRPGFRVVRVPTTPQHRDVYLPGKGDWYDFWTGQRTTGGQTLSPETPIERIPLYVRAGSIIPMGPEMQYVAEKPADPIELRVYRGADGAFPLYEDEGDNYNYEKGAFSEIPITWDDKSRTLGFGERKGTFPGMPAKRTFHVIWVKDGHGAGEEPLDQGDVDVNYDGTATSVQAPGAQ